MFHAAIWRQADGPLARVKGRERGVVGAASRAEGAGESGRVQRDRGRRKGARHPVIASGRGGALSRAPAQRGGRGGGRERREQRGCTERVCRRSQRGYNERGCHSHEDFPLGILAPAPEKNTHAAACQCQATRLATPSRSQSSQKQPEQPEAARSSQKQPEQPVSVSHSLRALRASAPLDAECSGLSATLPPRHPRPCAACSTPALP
jgi:hypothetical protein